MAMPPFFIALIATHNRPKLLAKRSLPSVAAQQCRPDMVVVVDDSDSRFRARNKKVALDFGVQADLRVLYVENDRRRCASGAWNSGVLAALDEIADDNLESVYLAILDDDDEWLSCHLKNAKAVICASDGKQVDWLAAAFERREPTKAFPILPPATKNSRAFFVGNPGVGGSTLIMRLPAFLRAGMFDEALLAGTDCDLCFRLSLLPQLNYVPLQQVSVVHYADEDRPRITNKSGGVKHIGLTHFADKYRGLMSDEEYVAFSGRAKKLFGWTPPQIAPRSPEPALPQTPVSAGGEKISLVIGLIADTTRFPNELLADILRLAKDKRLLSVDVVVMPSSDYHRGSVNAEVAKWRNAGLRMYCVDFRSVKLLHKFFDPSQAQRPIAVNRTILQHAMSRLAKPYRHPVFWVLDGDARLSALRAESGRIVSFRPDYVGEMMRLRATGCDAAVGAVCGAAPLPRALSVRTQLVDLFYLLGRLLSPGRGRHAPQYTITATPEKMQENYHHDCLPHPHLEQPIGVWTKSPVRTAGDVIAKLPVLLERLLAGDVITRPLLANESGYLQRGGNTFIFNGSMLSDYPNGFSVGALAAMRREDEMWRILSETVYNYRIVSGFFPVMQVRDDEPPQAPDVERLASDIAGQAVMKAFKQTVGAQCGDLRQAMNSIVYEDFHRLMRGHADKRLTLLRASFYRIAGITACIRSMVSDFRGKGKKEAVAALDTFEQRFTQAAFAEVKQQTHAWLTPAVLRDTLQQFPDVCESFSSLKGVWVSWLREQRKLNATALIRNRQKNTSLRFLGQGEEGVIFTDNQRVFKVLHRWYAREEVSDANFLPSNCTAWRTHDGKRFVERASSDGGDLILTMPYEKTMPYKGGCGAGMVRLLASCIQNGIVYFDIRPENLRRKGWQIFLIDYGNDIRPYTERDFDLSVRKAWLSWRWSWRSDIRSLLSASVHTADMPELFGYEIMKVAAKQYAAHARTPDAALQEVQRLKLRHVLDYGCGKGKEAAELARQGFAVTAYDSSLTKAAVRRLNAAGVEIARNIDALDGGYDVVLLRHVVCEISSDAALRDCLSHVRRLLAPKGKAIVTSCNLTELVEHTTCARNFFPRNACVNQKVNYRKEISSMGVFRQHVHRPESVLLREFARAGLQVEKRHAVDEIDLDNFESCGGVVQYTLRPLPVYPPTALVIRACAMDAPDAEFQVRHLVRQLGAPRGFAKVILAIDVNEKSFLRQHQAANLSLMNAVARRLLRQGWIDQIVHSPTSLSSVRRLNRRWMGVDSDSSQSANHNPLSGTFAAFAACKQRFALHIDIDMLVGRQDMAHDYLGEMLKQMLKRDAFTMSLNVPGSGAAVSVSGDEKTPFRLEVRAGLTDLQRMKKKLPLPVRVENGLPAVGWQRATDALIARDNLLSLRGGDQRLFCVHPANEYKQRRDAMDIVANAVENGRYGDWHHCRGNDWDGKEDSWLPAPRHENFIFVVCGRNVSQGKLDRCLQSVDFQRRKDWGVILMDDASDANTVAHLRRWTEAHANNATLFNRRQRAGGLTNLVFAVRHLCGNPESVIVTLDMDDALLCDDVLCRLHREYQQGADVTVGSMLRTDKSAVYPVCFDNPRENKGGNVWQHLRSFRKHLFDSIPDAALRQEQGDYYDLAADWAYMLPIVEFAKQPVWIREPLYFYQPDVRFRKQQFAEREAAIGRIMRSTVFFNKEKK